MELADLPQVREQVLDQVQQLEEMVLPPHKVLELDLAQPMLMELVDQLLVKVLERDQEVQLEEMEELLMKDQVLDLDLLT